MEPSEPRPYRRGSYAVLVAVTGVMLLGFGAIAVDLSVLELAKDEAQVAADAAALAGASHLDGTDAGLAAARQSALALGSLNEVRNLVVTLRPEAIELGIWDSATRAFTPSTDAATVDAVRVTHVVEDVPTPLASVAFGLPWHDVTATSIAWRPPGEGPHPACFLPIAIPSCLAHQIEARTPPVASLQLANDSDDQIGWAYPGPVVNGALTAEQLAGLADGTCATGGGPAVEIGTSLSLQNGVSAANLFAVRTQLVASDDPWDTEDWGPKPPADPGSLFSPARYPGLDVVQGFVPVFQEVGACDAVRFTGSAPVSELVWGVVFDVFAGAGAHKGIQIYLDAAHEGSGGPYEVRPPARLVE